MELALTLVEADGESRARRLGNGHDHGRVLVGGESGIALVGEDGDVLGNRRQFLAQARLGGFVERLLSLPQQVLLERKRLTNRIFLLNIRSPILVA